MLLVPVRVAVPCRQLVACSLLHRLDRLKLLRLSVCRILTVRVGEINRYPIHMPRAEPLIFGSLLSSPIVQKGRSTSCT
jgi:hypothetical protein